MTAHYNGCYSMPETVNVEVLLSKYNDWILNSTNKTPFSYGGAVSGIILSVKFKTIHSKNNNLIGLLEMALVDESCAQNPVLYQCWGQNATDKFRHMISCGCLVTIGNVTVSQRNDSPHLIKGDIIYVRGGVQPVIDLNKDHHIFSSKFRQSILLLEGWADAYPLTSMIRNTFPVAVSAARFSDMVECTHALLFDISLHLVVNRDRAVINLVDRSGAAANLQFATSGLKNRFDHQLRERLAAPDLMDEEETEGVLGARHLAVILRAVGVGGSYHGVVKRITMYQQSSLEFPPPASTSHDLSTASLTKSSAPPPDCLAWSELRRIMGDSRLLHSHTGTRKVVRCSLNGLSMESDRIKGGDGIDMRRNIAVLRERHWDRAAATRSQTAEQQVQQHNEIGVVAGLQSCVEPDEAELNVRVVYRDISALLGEPADSSATRQQLEVLRAQLGVVWDEQQQHCAPTLESPSHHLSDTTPTPSLSMPLSSYMASTDEFRAVMHDTAITRLLCGIPAALIALQLDQTDADVTSESSTPQFDYLSAAKRLIDALQQCALDCSECWVVLQLHPVADENGLLLADCVLAIERIVWC